ncbi:uroporphyrinogen-III synthase, partial [Wolbachia endosymbiont of Pentidionis agamae]|uniref:uroporphyrinogen-III synthase n=1 Tax=Wolbachia endosymbiont of Pentidionis agamae TaxID=3110435 RepID=UPI002FD52105
MFRVEYLYPDLHPYEFHIIIATSKNSIIAFSNMSERRDIPIITVGNATMQAARDSGFTDVVSAGSDINGLILLITTHYSKETRFLYIRGEEITFDLKKKLLNEDFCVEECTLYKTIAKKKFTNRCKNLISTNIMPSIMF